MSELFRLPQNIVISRLCNNCNSCSCRDAWRVYNKSSSSPWRWEPFHTRVFDDAARRTLRCDWRWRARPPCGQLGQKDIRPQETSGTKLNHFQKPKQKFICRLKVLGLPWPGNCRRVESWSRSCPVPYRPLPSRAAELHLEAALTCSQYEITWGFLTFN